MNICIYGASSDLIDKKYISAGEELGRLMASRGHKLVYGAGGKGMMGAVSRGIKECGGFVLGVVPEFFTNEEILNLECDEIIRTETMRERKQVMEDSSDAFIVTPGGIGTFEEFFEILTLKQLGRHNKPIMIFNIDGFYDTMLKMLEENIEKKFLREECRSLYPSFNNAVEMLDAIENYTPIDLTFMKKQIYGEEK
ncbi:MAG: TIGR00730 family Rossman fold protein [Clostridia bacterium]|nr:TIGR00730 family Rossman fold protein [Clostridia bacterium]